MYRWKKALFCSLRVHNLKKFVAALCAEKLFFFFIFPFFAPLRAAQHGLYTPNLLPTPMQLRYDERLLTSAVWTTHRRRYESHTRSIHTIGMKLVGMKIILFLVWTSYRCFCSSSQIQMHCQTDADDSSRPGFWTAPPSGFCRCHNSRSC